MDATEFEDRNGDLWTIDECTGEDNCVVVTKWWPPATGQEADDIDNWAEFATPPSDDDEAPRPGYREASCIHIPLESVGDLIAALRCVDRKAGAQ